MDTIYCFLDSYTFTIIDGEYPLSTAIRLNILSSLLKLLGDKEILLKIYKYLEI